MSNPVCPGQETLLTTMPTERRGAMLEQARTAKMARSAHAYVRGNTAKGTVRPMWQRRRPGDTGG